MVKWAYLRSILIHHSIDGVIPYLGEEEEKAHFQVLLVGESHRHLHEPGQVNSSLPAKVEHLHPPTIIYAGVRETVFLPNI